MNGSIKDVEITPELVDFMREIVPNRKLKDTQALINDRFGLDLNELQVKNLKQKLHLKSGLQGSGWHGPRHCKEPGTEFITKDGTVLIKADDEYRKTHHTKSGWVAKARYIYETEVADVPEDHVVIFINKNRRDFRPENLMVVPKQIQSVLAVMKYDYWNEESLAVAIKLAEIQQKIHEATIPDCKCRICGKTFRSNKATRHVCRQCSRKRRKEQDGSLS